MVLFMLLTMSGGFTAIVIAAYDLNERWELGLIGFCLLLFSYLVVRYNRDNFNNYPKRFKPFINGLNYSSLPSDFKTILLKLAKKDDECEIYEWFDQYISTHISTECDADAEDVPYYDDIDWLTSLLPSKRYVNRINKKKL